ncbi:MAG TPA: hypothetical protein VFR21_25490, partial [Bradyrhizobium sp.]|nr:hypothetical protein [Bradyrhizobium sp.]
LASAPLLSGLLCLLQLYGLGTLIKRIGSVLGGRPGPAALREFRGHFVVLACASLAALAFIRAQTDRSDSKCLFPARCDVIHHACW